MYYIQQTESFKKKVKGLERVNDVVQKLAHFVRKVSDLKYIGGISSFPKDMYVYRKQYEFRLIIQKKVVEVNGENYVVLFFRDLIHGQDLDFHWSKKAFIQLKDGSWLKENPLDSLEEARFRSSLEEELVASSKKLSYPPHTLNNWLNNYQLKISFDVYETESWVNYATDLGVNGLAEKYIIFFLRMYKKLIEAPHLLDIKVLPETAGKLKQAVDAKEQLGLLYSELEIEGRKRILIYAGAHLLQQKEEWEKRLEEAKNYTVYEEPTKQAIGELAFRAYPSWVLDNEDYWCIIQRSKGINNLSLLPEQVNFLEGLRFPHYINGQAGSGKSTMLCYVFANVYYYKVAEEFEGDIIFLTENENLIADTNKAIMSLLQLNPEFSGIPAEDRTKGKVGKQLQSFKGFLLDLLPEKERKEYDNRPYLDFGEFKSRYNKDFSRRQFSAEELWFVLSTYIYGYFEEEVIDTVSAYFEKVPKEFRLLEDRKYLERLFEEAIRFYKNLQKENYWDKNQLVRKIREIFPKQLPKQYSAIFCDEAQDFSRIELRLIIESSIYINYDLSQSHQQVPLVFAGDALQTVNPLGFSVNRLHQMIYDILIENKFKYQKKASNYDPKYNYRSIDTVVRLSNIIQNYRAEIFKEAGRKQEAKIKSNKKNEKLPALYSIEWLSDRPQKEIFFQKFTYKSFIVPIDLNEEEAYVQTQPLLVEGQFKDIKSSIAAKGAEYGQVVVYGFGTYFIQEYGPLERNKGSQNDFKLRFFFNKLYVALTRAQRELVIVDSEEAIEKFWKTLLEQKEIKDPWVDLSIDDIALIEPKTLNEISMSSKEDAFENANTDLTLGKKNANVARLTVAANIFFQLGENKLAYEALAEKEALVGRPLQAGEYFAKAGEKRKARDIYFSNAFWSALLKLGANDEQSLLEEKIARLMYTGNWSIDELLDVASSQHALYGLTRQQTWRLDFIDKILLFSQAKTAENKRLIAVILASVVAEGENKIYEKIADIYYEAGFYERAITFWDKVSYTENEFEIPIEKTTFYGKYTKAQIQLASQNSDDQAIFLWTGRLLFYPFLDKNDLEYAVDKLYHHYYQEKPSWLQNLAETDEKQPYCYAACLLKNDFEGIQKEGLIFETNSKLLPKEKLAFYNWLSALVKNESINLYIRERWAKIYFEKIADRNLEQLNKKYQAQSFAFEEKDFSWTQKQLEEIYLTPQGVPLHPPAFYKSFQLQNFKGFKNLELHDLGQYNLILGNNNVGKTSLLEALTLSDDVNELGRNFIYLLGQRKQLTAEEIYFPHFRTKSAAVDSIKYKITSGRRSWNYELKNKDEFSDQSASIEERLLLYVNGQKKSPESYKLAQLREELDTILGPPMYFIPFAKGYTKELVESYYEAVGSAGRKVKDQFRDEVMKLFIPNIYDIDHDPKRDEIIIEEENGQRLPLYDYGEGANKLFRIMVQLYACSGKRLMIDEIDAGIHYSKFKTFWKIILKAAALKKVQLFVSTHNDECIQYFIQALRELEAEKEDATPSFTSEARVITLERHLDSHEVVPLIQDFESMEYAEDFEIDLRGRKHE